MLISDAMCDVSAEADGKPAGGPEALGLGLRECFLPELGSVYRGKVRDCYTFEGIDPRDGNETCCTLRALVATDRISAFDRVFEQTIPGKGAVLNLLAAYFLERAARICPTHLVAVPDPNVTIARELSPYPVEVVVRGYLAGSAWRDCQEGVFEASYGFALPAKLQLNSRLEIPIVTPTDKAEGGHDQPLSHAQAAERVGGTDVWRSICQTALALFAQGSALAAERDLILVDTKYEFGHDGGTLTLMDEIHTPDSSRYWRKASYERDPAHPEQLSKEFLREWLRDQGFVGDGPVPALSDDVRLEISRRYHELFALLTGRSFAATAAAVGALGQAGTQEGSLGSRPALPVKERIVRNLKAAGYLRGSFVPVLMGSAADRAIGDKVAARLADLGIPSRPYIVSAHKVPDLLHRLVAEFNTSAQPLVVVAIAGRSNGLGGAAAANSVHPVISLPIFADQADYLVNIHSSLQLPGDTPALVVVDPANAALAAARMLALADPDLQDRVASRIATVREAFSW